MKWTKIENNWNGTIEKPKLVHRNKNNISLGSFFKNKFTYILLKNIKKKMINKKSSYQNQSIISKYLLHVCIIKFIFNEIKILFWKKLTKLIFEQWHYKKKIKNDHISLLFLSFFSTLSFYIKTLSWLVGL